MTCPKLAQTEMECLCETSYVQGASLVMQKVYQPNRASVCINPGCRPMTRKPAQLKSVKRIIQRTRRPVHMLVVNL
jgi:hypothetical protein